MVGDMLNVVIYPYDYEMQPYLQYNNMVENIHVKLLLTPSGWMSGNNQQYGYKVQTSLSDIDYIALDAIWITDSINKIEDNQICEVVEDMLSHNKQIILSRHMRLEVYNHIAQLVNQYAGKLTNLLEYDHNIDIENVPLQLYELYTPIINVIGLGERTDKFLIQLAMKDYFERQGYNVILVASRTNSFFLHNVYCFPEFMNENIPAEYKIILYNHFLKEIEEKQKPEVIITGIPGEIMPISKLQPGHFGIHAYQILNAIMPDINIMCLYSNSLSNKYISELKMIMKYKFIADIDCLYFGSHAQDVFSLARSQPVEYILINETDRNQLRDELETEMNRQEHIFVETDMELMGQYVISCLHENYEMEVL